MTDLSNSGEDKSADFAFSRAGVRSAFTVAALGTIGFGLISLLYYDFVLDDAFISYRYARNLAEAHTLAWNIGERPVEGFTSFMWVMLNAAAIIAGADPVIFSKAISAVSAVLVIWMLATAGRRLSRPVAFVLVWAVALSAPFVFLTWQGMETTFTSLLLLASALLSLRLLKTPSAAVISAWYFVAFLCALTRPDTVVFILGVAAGLLAMFAVRRDWVGSRRFVLLAMPWVALGVVYVAWRVSYFGYPLPNTFYVKARPAAAFSQLAGTGYQFQGIEYVASFGYSVLFPYIVLVVIGLSGQLKDLRQRVLPVIPIVIGSLAFGCYVLTIIPIQGLFWRFLFPVFPAFLLAAIVCLSGPAKERFEILSRPLAWALVALFAAWSLYLVPQGLFEKKFRTLESRIRVGERLAGLSGTMLVEDSGAIPYYSGWRTADILGLVSEEITHQGLSLDYLTRLNPDVVCIYTVDRYNGGRDYGERGRIITEFLRTQDYVAVAVILKSLNNWNYFFVKRDSPLFSDVVDRLLTVPGVTYGNVEQMMAGEDVPVYKAGRR